MEQRRATPGTSLNSKSGKGTQRAFLFPLAEESSNHGCWEQDPRGIQNPVLKTEAWDQGRGAPRGTGAWVG